MNQLQRLLERIGRRRVGNPAVIAHRGASLVSPENTLTAFDLAIDVGADAVEFDVRVTADEDLVVMHDARLGRTTSSGRPVIALTAEQVGALDAGVWFHREFRGEVVPFVEEALDTLRGRAVPIVEIKDHGERGVIAANQLAASLRDMDMSRDVLVISGNLDALSVLRELSPETPNGVVSARFRKALSLMDTHDGAFVWWKSFGEQLVSSARSANKFVAAWVVPTSCVERFARSGVDAIVTDDPESTVKAMRRAP